MMNEAKKVESPHAMIYNQRNSAYSLSEYKIIRIFLLKYVL